MASVLLLGNIQDKYFLTNQPNVVYRFGTLLTSPSRYFYKNTHTGPTPWEKKSFRYDLVPALKDIAFKIIYIITGLFVLDLIACAIVGLSFIGKHARDARQKSLETSISNHERFNIALSEYNDAFMKFHKINELKHCESNTGAVSIQTRERTVSGGKTYFSEFQLIQKIIETDLKAEKDIIPEGFEQYETIIRPWKIDWQVDPEWTLKRMNTFDALEKAYSALFQEAHRYFKKRLTNARNAFNVHINS